MSKTAKRLEDAVLANLTRRTFNALPTTSHILRRCFQPDERPTQLVIDGILDRLVTDGRVSRVRESFTVGGRTWTEITYKTRNTQS